MLNYGLQHGDAGPEKVVWDQFRVWKNHIPSLYDHLAVYPLEWPAISVQWLPEDNCMEERGSTLNYLLLGTQAFEENAGSANDAAVFSPNDGTELRDATTSAARKQAAAAAAAPAGGRGGSPNAIYNMEIELPTASEYHSGPSPYPFPVGRCVPKQRMAHQGDVNCVKYMPQNPHVVASRGPVRGGAHSTVAPVYIYNLDMSPDLTEQGGSRADAGNNSEIDPALILQLTGHKSEGVALSWNQKREGLLASGADDGLVMVWDLAEQLSPSSLTAFEKGQKTTEKGIGPSCILQGHEGSVQCLDFHPLHQHLLFSASDDRCIRIWDTRLADKGSMTNVRNAHSSAINCIQAHPIAEHVIATAGKDVVKIWDMRFERRSEPAMTLKGHTGEILSLEWAPHREYVLATGSMDRSVIVWNIERNSMPENFESGRLEACPWLADTCLGEYFYAPPKAEPGWDDMDIPREVMFVHFGHTAPVTDISWNPNEDWVIASAAADNFLHVWQPAQNCYDGDGSEFAPDLSDPVEMQPMGAGAAGNGAPIANVHVPLSGDPGAAGAPQDSDWLWGADAAGGSPRPAGGAGGGGDAQPQSSAPPVMETSGTGSASGVGGASAVNSSAESGADAAAAAASAAAAGGGASAAPTTEGGLSLAPFSSTKPATPPTE